MGVALGFNTPRENRAFAHWVVQKYRQLVVQRHGKVKWSHVKGHGEHKWNDVVDDLATGGASKGAFTSSVPGKVLNRTKLDGGLFTIKYRLGCNVIAEIKLVTQEWGWDVIEPLRQTPRLDTQVDFAEYWVIQAGKPPDQASNLTCMVLGKKTE